MRVTVCSWHGSRPVMKSRDVGPQTDSEVGTGVLVGELILVTDGAGFNKLMGILIQGLPPWLVPEKFFGPLDPWVADQMRTVALLEHLKPELGCPDPLLYSPGDGRGQVNWWKDGVCLCGTLLHSLQKLIRQGVGLDIVTTWSVGESKIEASEEVEPAGLPGIQSLGCPEVF